MMSTRYLGLPISKKISHSFGHITAHVCSIGIYGFNSKSILRGKWLRWCTTIHILMVIFSWTQVSIWLDTIVLTSIPSPRFSVIEDETLVPNSLIVFRTSPVIPLGIGDFRFHSILTARSTSSLRITGTRSSMGSAGRHVEYPGIIERSNPAILLLYLPRL